MARYEHSRDRMESCARTFRHWVVFVRDDGGARVLDPKKSLRRHVRTDSGA
jgi:hypothetical protein